MATDPRRTHDLDQHAAAAEDTAAIVAAFYKRLRALKVPPVAAQGLTERFVDALMTTDAPEAW